MYNFINMKNIMIILTVFSFLLAGCYNLTLYEKKKNESDPQDQGAKTEFSIKGPKAEITHKF